MKKIVASVMVYLLISGIPAQAETEQVSLAVAKGERLSAAIGHYARARSLIIAAIREFDDGLKLANPSILIDVKEWRGDLISRAEDLERVLDPQPRASRSGVKFEADSRLLNEAKR